MATLQLLINQNLFLKDPQDTDLGRKIVQKGIIVIDCLGFEKFTFKKLAKEIDSTEASIYRYFENKHKLLIYLHAWYWNWLEYKIDFQTQNIEDPTRELEIALRIIAEKKEKDPFFPQIDEAALYRIIVDEYDKGYLTKQVDEDNKEGLFRGMKSLCHKVANMISKVNKEYPYPHTLVSTVFHAAHQQLFYAQHLPALTEVSSSKGDLNNQIEKYIKSLVFNNIKQ